MHPAKPTELALRLTLAWALASGLGLVLGRRLVEALTPLFNIVITMVQDDFAPTLEIDDGHGQETSLAMTAFSVRHIHLAGRLFIRNGVVVDSFHTTLFHILVPAVILLTMLLAWPLSGWREASARFVLGIPASIGTLLCITPLYLVGRYDMYISDLATRAGARPPDTWLIRWAVFSEMGGNWLLPVVVATVCIMLARRLADAATPAA